LLKLLIVFGGRRVTEVIEAPWSEFDLQQGLWNRPPTRDKKGRHVLMPIGRMAHELLAELEQYTGGKKYLFGDKPPTPYAINQSVRRIITGRMEHFTPKSLRATAKTLMGQLKISKEARDRYHSHALNDVSSRHYDKYDYLDQKKEVVRVWEGFLADVLAGKPHQPGLRAVS
jgi:integrase